MTDRTSKSAIDHATQPSAVPVPNDRAAPDPRLSVILNLLAEETRVGGVSLGELSTKLPAGTPFLMCALLSLPFCQPVPLLGLSTPFGIAIFLVSAGWIFGRSKGLPSKLANVHVLAHFFPTVFKAAGSLMSILERFLRRRQVWLARGIWKVITAVVVALSGLLLMLPLPVPFSNTFPALTILALSLGLTEKDGYTIVAGAFLFTLTLGFYVGILLVGAGAFTIFSGS